MTDQIDDPIQLIAHCNKHIQKLEMYIEMTEKQIADGDFDKMGDLARMEGHLVKWTEELEHAIHQAFQQGKTKTDVSIASKKKARLNASGTPA